MSKIWIKPLRSLFVGDTALKENKVAELPEDEANELLKNGWAELAEKPKAKGKSKTDDVPPSNPPATLASQDNDPPSDDQQSSDEQQNGDGEQQSVGEQQQQAENQNA